MSISPTGKTPSPLLGNSRPSRLTDDERAERSAREAQAKIDDSEKRVSEAEREADVRIDHLRNDGDNQVEAEAVRQEASVEAEKNRGYAALREIKAAQQAELNRVRREGERELAQSKDYYRNALYTTEKQGREDLQALDAHEAKSKEFADKSHLTEMDETQSAHTYEIAHLKEHQEQQFHDLDRSAREEYDRYRLNTEEAKKKADLEFHQKYQAVKSDHDGVIADLEARTGGEIRRTRQDTAAKLAAYSARQDEPFYRMVDVDASLKDDGDAFILRATIPEHERDHVSVAVRGNQVVLSGDRRNEEKLDLGPGRSKSTNSFQSFHESFALNWPVDTKTMTKTYEGDELVVTIPKRSASGEPLQREVEKPEKARLERPKFPGNLPLSKYEQAERSKDNSDLTPPDADSPRKKGTRTLA